MPYFRFLIYKIENKVKANRNEQDMNTFSRHMWIYFHKLFDFQRLTAPFLSILPRLIFFCTHTASFKRFPPQLSGGNKKNPACLEFTGSEKR